ncbi:MAG: hypothetical protein U0X91_03240 [Spirosomataceae bacterium]
MNREFKLRFDQMRENDLSPTAGEEAFLPPSSIRNVCLGWPNGRRMFLNYAYLTAGEFIPEGETNQIILYFSTCSVTLRGYTLQGLFRDLLNHNTTDILITEERYLSHGKEGQPVVMEIKVKFTES